MIYAFFVDYGIIHTVECCVVVDVVLQNSSALLVLFLRHGMWAYGASIKRAAAAVQSRSLLCMCGAVVTGRCERGRTGLCSLLCCLLLGAASVQCETKHTQHAGEKKKAKNNAEIYHIRKKRQEGRAGFVKSIKYQLKIILDLVGKQEGVQYLVLKRRGDRDMMSNLPGAFAASVKCSCCNNPWNQTDTVNSSDRSASDTSFLICSPCLSDNKGFSGIDPANFDPNVPVGENFFLWSNGGWKEKNPIPAEYSSWNTFIALRDLNLDRLKSILEDLTMSDPSSATEEHAKLSAYNAAFMNEARIDSLGLEPLAELVDTCLKAENQTTESLATLHSKYGVNVFFSIYSSPDKANSEHSICTLYQNGLGLPDRDYYFDANKADKREKYVKYVAMIFELLCESFPKVAHIVGNPEDAAKDLLEYETLLAKMVM